MCSFFIFKFGSISTFLIHHNVLCALQILYVILYSTTHLRIYIIENNLRFLIIIQFILLFAFFFWSILIWRILGVLHNFFFVFLLFIYWHLQCFVYSLRWAIKIHILKLPLYLDASKAFMDTFSHKPLLFFSCF
jgi:hypothetical protein